MNCGASFVTDDGTAADAARLFSPQRLRLAREARGLTQTGLSRLIGTSAAAVSQFEKADARPSASTVALLAQALSFPAGFFAVGSSPSSRADGDPDTLDGHGHFRSLRSVTAAQRRQALSVTQLVRDMADALSRHVRLPDPAVPLLAAGAGDLAAAEERAATVRRAWGVPPGPVTDVIQVAERHGIVTARQRIPAPTISGYSVPFPERPVVIVGRDGAKRDRDRFSVSHEIGHLVMHEAGSSLASKETEAQANRFASAFLLPADEIRDQLPPVPDWVQLLTLKQRWHVSLSALLRRASDLGVMSDQVYGQAMRTVGARGWRISEPGDLGAPESPRVLALAIETAGAGTASLAAETGWPATLIEEVVAASADSRPALEI
ncbi:ImmA/IrrE family metallo-endopeptidase [Trebonia kvetii]|uniref:ImmA/IrrE family metallo-endopeptidase n=1 Tax=Trebonia kvetii TaxID=2480626 RepID=A0A6P2C5M6_9ACTN|nr:ImmA/IrrE family metallo-endopeptidase [Trebonia kvetii]